MNSTSGMSPCPGKHRKCRLQDSTSMSSQGASASCTRKIRSLGIACSGFRSVLRAQDMEGVEHEADRRMIRAPHDLPGIAVVVDVAAPGQRLEADAQPTFDRPLAERAEVGGGAVDAAERFRRHIAAHHQQIAADFLHQIKLALGTIEGARPLRLRHALEIAEWLERNRLQAKIGTFLWPRRQACRCTRADRFRIFRRRGIRPPQLLPASRSSLRSGRPWQWTSSWFCPPVSQRQFKSFRISARHERQALRRMCDACARHPAQCRQTAEMLQPPGAHTCRRQSARARPCWTLP